MICARCARPVEHKHGDLWHCTCGNTPCDGLDCGVWLPGQAPRKQSTRPAHLVSADRLRAWETRRAKYGKEGHR